ncbi:hypothetical protein CDFC105_63324 [Clostridioides difficile]|nr:hypothetical protein CDFC105_63324 [Clostridioides difficile]
MYTKLALTLLFTILFILAITNNWIEIAFAT